MALKFKKSIETESGITIENIYARLEYKQLAEGKKVQVNVKYYASESAYQAKKFELKTDFPGEQLFDYDRFLNGKDVLQFVHDKFKQNLIDSYKIQPMTAEKLDENGDPVLNEDGEVVIETIGTIYFFTDADLLIEL